MAYDKFMIDGEVIKQFETVWWAIFDSPPKSIPPDIKDPTYITIDSNFDHDQFERFLMILLSLKNKTVQLELQHDSSRCLTFKLPISIFFLLSHGVDNQLTLKKDRLLHDHPSLKKTLPNTYIDGYCKQENHYDITTFLLTLILTEKIKRLNNDTIILVSQFLAIPSINRLPSKECRQAIELLDKETHSKSLSRYYQSLSSLLLGAG